MVIHEMLEAVSRDGNYAINIPLTPDGELDPGGVQTLEDMGAWMEVNSEGIYDCSAWKVRSEGSVTMAGDNLGRGQAKTLYTGQCIRFTTKDGALYAYLMAWSADGKVTIHSLPAAAGQVSDVALLGSKDRPDWQQTEAGLAVRSPAGKPCDFAYGLKIRVAASNEAK